MHVPDTRPAPFEESSPYGYIYVGMSVDPPRHAPLVRGSARRNASLSECRTLASQLEALDEVVRATVYRSVLIPPVQGTPRFDVTLLVQTTSPMAIDDVRSSEPFERLGADFVMPARNIRRIGDTGKTLTGSFLFNHFTAEDPEGAVDAFDAIAGWYTTELGIDNATLLQPTEAAPYAFVNYVRLPRGPIRFLLDQFVTPSFHTFVRATLRDNNMTAMPLLCEPV